MKSSYNYKFVFKNLGFLIVIESFCMLASGILSFYWSESVGYALVLSAIITFLSGILFSVTAMHFRDGHVGKRESFSVVTLTWVLMSFFGMFPFYISNAIPNITDAYFETMSGFSATGATIFTDIESVPRGLLLWRSLTQWIGGIGIIVFALVLLPMMGGNASVLYEAETTGMVQEKFRPRIGQVAKHLFASYCLLTIILIFLLWLGPMSLFDSICHALTTLSTGGFSTKSTSIAYWDSPYIDYIITLFMFIGGVNFFLIYYMLRGTFSKVRKDEELRWYIFICLGLTLIIMFAIMYDGYYSNAEDAFRNALFQVVSFVTTTAFSTTDAFAWGTFYVFMFMNMMLFCACAGSTTGGMKLSRLIVLCKNAINEFKLQVHPNAVLAVRLNGNVVPSSVVSKVLSFIFLYAAIITFSLIVFSLQGMNFEEAVGISISSASNIGVGFGKYAEAGHFAEASSFTKWYMSLLMLTGRLEIFTVLSLFIPSFWKK